MVVPATTGWLFRYHKYQVVLFNSLSGALSATLSWVPMNTNACLSLSYGITSVFPVM
jgi:hypothetical protein